MTPKTIANFWSHVYKAPDGCWEWQGWKNSKGYGRIRFAGNRTHFAHRFSWLIHYGSLPLPEFCILHHCDNPSCVNPSHLWVGTKGENVADMVTKGRWGRGGLRAANTPRGERHGQAKLTETDVREIRRRRAAGEEWTQLGRAFGVSRTTAASAGRGHTWRCLG